MSEQDGNRTAQDMSPTPLEKAAERRNAGPARAGVVEDTAAGSTGASMPIVEGSEQTALIATSSGGFELATDPVEALERAERLVRAMAVRCTGERYIARISNRDYPKVDWWTTIGMVLGLFPVVITNRRLDRADELAYEATVEIHHRGRLITRGEALCSNAEARWKTADEYAIKSMAATRATGKAFRLGLSGLAVMAGLEPTPAEEMDGVRTPATRSRGGDFWHSDHGYGSCPLHPGLYFGMRGNMKSPAHPFGDGQWCNEDRVKQSFRAEANAILGKLFPADLADRADQLREWLKEHEPLIAEVDPENRTAKDWAAIAHAAREVTSEPAPASPDDDDETPW